MTLNKYQYYPLPAISALGGFIIYKTIFWSGYLAVILPTFPLAILFSLRRNIIDNLRASVERIELMPDGNYIRVRDLSGKVRQHPIDGLRKATDQEMIKICQKGGPAFAERMRDFYPVIISSSVNSVDRGRQEIREITGDSILDIIFIDNKGVIADKHLLTAILTGHKIEMETTHEIKI